MNVIAIVCHDGHDGHDVNCDIIITVPSCL